MTERIHIIRNGQKTRSDYPRSFSAGKRALVLPTIFKKGN